MFLKSDLKQIKEKIIPLSTVYKQLENFEKGFPYLQLIEAATIERGIKQIDKKNINRLVELYDNMNICPEKFVPASGAASRMFKNLFKASNADFNNDSSLIEFFTNINSFAFYNDLKSAIHKHGEGLADLIRTKNYKKIIDYLLEKDGLNYADLPKALLKFHKYEKDSRTAAEEHLVEAVAYCTSSDGIAKVHFTISPEQGELFKKYVKSILPEYEKKFSVKFDISFSVQKSSTETIAVNKDNSLFRDDNGNIVFRPGGHGALIENLNEIDSDIVFIKNIDNVVPDRLKEQTIIYKKVLAGLLLEYSDKMNSYLLQLECKPVDDKLLSEIISFLENELCVFLPESYNKWPFDNQISFIRQKLDRPIRICGMVKNEGEPGGGPFWVKNDDGSVSLQIVEEAQINKNSKDQLEIFKSSTHFNPVDLVCLLKNKGKKFDLLKYRNQNTGLITTKPQDDELIKVQELPGLWNGAMYDWNTIFIEVPLITFNPVKTINDLLREQHQSF